MGNFFTSLFSSSKPAEATEDKAKNEQKNFDILKYDGVRAQKMGKLVYAIKCFTEALNIQEDFETMSYLVSAYTMANDLGKAEDVLNRMVEMEPDHIATRLTRVNLLFMLDKDAEVITDCLHVIELEPSNHVAYFMMAKAKKATNDVFGAIADLTRSISLKEDFADSYLLRAEILLGWFTIASPANTVPSNGMTLPMCTTMLSPCLIWEYGTRISPSSVLSHTFSTLSDMILARSPTDFLCVQSSNNSPIPRRNITEPAVS